MWQAHPNKSGIHSIIPNVLQEFTDKRVEVNATVLGPLCDITADPHLSNIQPPEKAYAWAFGSLDQLAKEFEAWCNFVEVVRGLQRSLLELSAFADWWHDIQEGEEFHPPFRPPTHGAIFDNQDIYANHAHWSITTYLIIPNDCCPLNPMKQVNLSPWTSSRMDEMTVHPLMHSLPLWYYPPQVADIYTDLETAAHGYTEHLDTFNPTKGFKRKLDKLENQKADDSEFPLGIHSDCHSPHFSRWSQGQEGKVNSRKKAWPIQQQGTAMNP